MDLKFMSISGGIEIIDPIERHRDRILIPGSTTFQCSECDLIPYPVDSAISTTTSKLSLPFKELIYIHDETGSIITEVRPDEELTLPPDTYILDVSVSMKTYIYVESGLEIYFEDGKTCVDLGNSTNITIGARSYHTQPAGTITTTSDPTDIMKAVSIFGSALKTLKPERSYPTLRGHPPTIKLGKQLKIPADLPTPETGIKIEIPESLNHIFAITPLAYYLGAEVVPGSKPQLSTENGYSFPLNEHKTFELTVERIMRSLFFLDCIVRTEGVSPGPLFERQAVESMLEFDIESVYEQSPAERLEAYLDTPFSAIESHCPKWHLTTQMQPKKTGINFLPFVAERLLIITVKDSNRQIQEQSHSHTVTNNKYKENSDTIPDHSKETPEPIIQQVVGSGNLRNISGITPLSAFYNNINRNPREDALEIEVVCNDRKMSKELIAVHSTYGTRKELPFDVNIHHDLTKDELRYLLAQDCDFIHYIGHIDSSGFRCSDGKLDASSLESVRTRAFFLNACQSYEQGLALVKRGSIGGIVTDEDIDNANAVKIGSTVARLLNQGYPLYATIDIIRTERDLGKHYYIVGDSTTSIAQLKNGVPNICSIDQNKEKTQISIKWYSSNSCGKGGILTPRMDGIDQYYLVPNEMGPITITKSQLIRFLDIDSMPILINDELRWSENISVSDI